MCPRENEIGLACLSNRLSSAPSSISHAKLGAVLETEEMDASLTVHPRRLEVPMWFLRVRHDEVVAAQPWHNTDFVYYFGGRDRD
jgi:hypothetical protein